MKNYINRNRFRNLSIGFSIACLFTLWAFNIEKPYATSTVEIYSSEPEEWQIDAFTLPPEEIPKEKEERKQKEEPSPNPEDLRNLDLVNDFKKIEPVKRVKFMDLNITKRNHPTAPPFIDPNAVELRPDNLAEFPGGKEALTTFLESHVNYPEMCDATNTSGMVAIKFIVDEQGKISNAQVVKDNMGCGAAGEAMRVLNQMPKWKPATKNGKPVRSFFVQTFVFRIF